MKVGKYLLRDNYGYPVTRFIGKPITNFIRSIIHTNVVKTILYKDKMDEAYDEYNDCDVG